MIAVLACNLIKLVCMALAIRSFSKPPLVVLGGAITSFLDKRDPITARLCMTVGPNSELVSYTEGILREEDVGKTAAESDRR